MQDSSKRPLTKQIKQQHKSQVQSKTNLRQRFASMQLDSKITVSCVFCQKLKRIATDNFSQLLTKALYSKYSSSQNYYHSKDINDLLDAESTPATAFYRDLETYLESEEYMKRLYTKKDIKTKKSALLEYYKYHRDIPRLFMKPVYQSINRFHDKRRRLEYARIKRGLGLPDDDEFTKHITKDKKDKGEKDVSIKQLATLLKGVNLDPSFKKAKPVTKSDILSQSQSFSFHLKDLLTVINNEKVQLQLLPANGYQIGNDLSIFERTMVQANGIVFEDLSRISSTSNKPKGIPYDQFKNQFKKQLVTRKPSYSPTTDLRSAQGSALLTVNPLVTRQVPYQSGSQTDRALSRELPSQDVQRQKPPGPPKKLNCNSIEHASNVALSSHYSTHSRASSNYTKGELNTMMTNLKNIQSPSTAIINANLLELQQLLKSNRTTISTLATQRADAEMRSTASKQMTTTLKGSTLLQLQHGRTRSQDNLPTATYVKASSPSIRPPSQHKQPPKNEPMRFDPKKVQPANNVYLQGQKKGPTYTINQNSIVNIYLNDPKCQNLKSLRMNGSQTSRGNSPPKFSSRKIYDCETHVSPIQTKRKN